MSRGTATSFDRRVVFSNSRVDFCHNRANKMLRFSEAHACFCIRTAVPYHARQTEKAENTS